MKEEIDKVIKEWRKEIDKVIISKNDNTLLNDKVNKPYQKLEKRYLYKIKEIKEKYNAKK